MAHGPVSEALVRLGNVLSYEEFSADGGLGTSNSFTSAPGVEPMGRGPALRSRSSTTTRSMRSGGHRWSRLVEGGPAGGAGEGHAEDHAVAAWVREGPAELVGLKPRSREPRIDGRPDSFVAFGSGWAFLD